MQQRFQLRKREKQASKTQENQQVRESATIPAMLHLDMIATTQEKIGSTQARQEANKKAKVHAINVGKQANNLLGRLQ